MNTNGEITVTPEEAAQLVRVLGFDSAHIVIEGPLWDKLKQCAAMVPPALNGDKLWNGYTRKIANNGKPHNQVETVVRAKNKAEAIRLLYAAGENVSAKGLKDYWSGCANREMQSVATERGVWAKGKDGWVKGKQ